MNIQLTQGKHAVVDDEHAHLLSRHKWFYNCGYAGRKMTGAKNVKIQMHRYIWELVNGPIPSGMQIDHVNGDSLDNRLENLRVVTRRQQSCNNRARRNGDTSSKYPGVFWDRYENKWCAQITVNGKQVRIGRFADEEEAAMAYQSTADSLR